MAVEGGAGRPGKPERLDQLLVRRALFESREQARRAVILGRVRVNGILERRPGQRVAGDAALEVASGDPGYASRGGQKLAGAFERLPVPVAGRIALDLGASTGGFTDVLLRRGAARVYAVDVGYGLLHARLRADARVVALERRNARFLAAADFDPRPDLAVADLAFISLRKVLPEVLPLLAPGWDALVLVKPQFEIGRGRVGRRGVVSRMDDHLEVLAGFLAWSASQGYPVAGSCPSPIRGPEGNREFFVHLAGRPIATPANLAELARIVVEESHATP